MSCIMYIFISIEYNMYYVYIHTHTESFSNPYKIDFLCKLRVQSCSGEKKKLGSRNISFKPGFQSLKTISLFQIIYKLHIHGLIMYT